MVNLWNPHNFSSIFSILLTAFLLGIIHGITPDEHTWPITLSYSLGSYSTRAGFKVGLFFSLAFTLQRAIASELSFFALSNFLTKPDVEIVVYIFVGIVMSFAGAYIIGLGKNFEFFAGIEKRIMIWLSRLFMRKDYHIHEEDIEASLSYGRTVPLYMALIHGFIAGWGTGAFAIIVYTVLAPKMPNAYTGFIPGLLFGIGTMLTQIIIGMSVGRFMEKLSVSQRGIEFIARRTSGQTLFLGGLAFVLAAVLEISFPKLKGAGIITPVRIHNLHSLGIGFFLVILIIFVIMAVSFVRSLGYVKNHPSEFRAK